jgi:hypothetical protein
MSRIVIVLLIYHRFQCLIFSSLKDEHTNNLRPDLFSDAGRCTQRSRDRIAFRLEFVDDGIPIILSPYSLSPPLSELRVLKAEEFCLLEHNAVYSAESQPTFRKNMSPSSSGSKSKLRKKPAWMQVASSAWHTENGGGILPRNFG